MSFNIFYAAGSHLLDIALWKKRLRFLLNQLEVKSKREAICLHVVPALSAGDKKFLLLMVCIYCDWPLYIYFDSNFLYLFENHSV